MTVPFLRWLGGKRKLSPRLIGLFPKDLGIFVEPFLGSGAVFLALEPTSAILSDSDPRLLEAWLLVKEDPHGLQGILEGFQASFSKDLFLWLRKAKFPTPLERAAQFIFLNHSSFNGLMRVNSKGEFNMPFGQKQRLSLDLGNLHKVSQALRSPGIKLLCQDAFSMEFPEGSFVFMDPPYDSPPGRGWTYQGEFPQERLANLFADLTSRGHRILQTNADTPRIRELYAGFQISEVSSFWGFRRQRKTELVIRNYG